MSKLIRLAGPMGTALALLAAAPAQAASEPAGGAATGEIVIATLGAGLLTTLLLAVGMGHRSGRLKVLGRVAAWTEGKTGLPGWAALPGAISSVALLVALLGMYWDISLHIDKGRDAGPLANPAHYLILAGLFGVFAAGFLAMVLPRERPGRSAVRITRDWHAPVGGVLLFACGAFSLAGFPLDDFWHRLFGQDVTLWGPTHLMLIGGAAMTLVGRSVLLVEGARVARAKGGGGSRSTGPSMMRFQRASLVGAFLIGLARAFGGAILFALPLLMTMEMWRLGSTMGELRLALFLAATLPVLGGLAYYAGFEESFGWRDFILFPLVAYAVAFTAAGAVLLLLAVLQPGMSADEVIGKLALQAVPASIGAMLARSQLGAQSEEQQEQPRRRTYGAALFLATVGALFLAFNVAPTEEVVLISQMMTGWHAVAVVLASLLMMHAFVYAVEFRGQAAIAPGVSLWSEFLRLTVVAYALALLVSLYVLWTFGRADGLPFGELLIETVVLGFPAALGAAAARLIL